MVTKCCLILTILFTAQLNPMYRRHLPRARVYLARTARLPHESSCLRAYSQSAYGELIKRVALNRARENILQQKWQHSAQKIEECIFYGCNDNICKLEGVCMSVAKGRDHYRHFQNQQKLTVQLEMELRLFEMERGKWKQK